MSETLNYQNHWDKAFAKSETSKLGWYESDVSPTLKLIETSNTDKKARILNVGAGSTTLVDSLLSKGYENVIANDISIVALETLTQRVGSELVQSIVDDLTNPQLLHTIPPVDLWIDRAVLHFFNAEEDKKTYFNLLKQLVKSSGYVIIAEFSLKGAEKCCALPVNRYSKEMIADRLGDEFSLIESFDYTYINPGGSERPYVYTLFKRN